MLETQIWLLERAEDEMKVLKAVTGLGGWGRKGRVGIYRRSGGSFWVNSGGDNGVLLVLPRVMLLQKERNETKECSVTQRGTETQRGKGG